MRRSFEDHLYSFERYLDAQVLYVNLFAHRRFPNRILRETFDLIVFHTSFLISRWTPDIFRHLMKMCSPLASMDATKVAIPQDEMLHSDLLTEFFDSFDIRHVFTAAAESDVRIIYPNIGNHVRFHRVLTGYLDPRTVDDAKMLARPLSSRPIDIGYRAWHGAPWLGRHGLLKQQIGVAVAAAAGARDLRHDVSLQPTDVITGKAWLKFLADCKATVGVEGGSSILDRTGELQRTVQAYLRIHPKASFSEVEAACFPNRDGEVNYCAISPRHLEACATKTVQILVEGDYNGVLVPERHYLPLKQDLSNLQECLDALADTAQMQEMVDTAYSEVVASGHYSYHRFVKDVVEVSLGTCASIFVSRPDTFDNKRPAWNWRGERWRNNLLVRPANFIRRRILNHVSEETVRRMYHRLRLGTAKEKRP